MGSNPEDVKLLKRNESSDILIEETTPNEIKSGTKIFVVGPPRSGTTLIYSMITNQYFLPECTFVSTLMKVFDEIYLFSDDERFDYYAHNLTNLTEIFKKPIHDLLYTATSKVSGKPSNLYVYKDPVLTLYLKYFQLFFGNTYKIVFCVRDPRDVVFSMLKVLKKQTSEVETAALFDQAIGIIFPYYHVIYNIENQIDILDKDKIMFVKYEEIVMGNRETIIGLERFLGSKINSTGINENVEGRLDPTSAFYSENYGKALTTNPIGGYKTSLDSDQILKIEHTFSYSMQRFNYHRTK